VRFSNRVPGDLSPNDLSIELDSHRPGVIDLTNSNPTTCGFTVPPNLYSSLPGDCSIYRPESQGLLLAREAVSKDLLRQGLSIPPQDIFLTSGTSEAYSLLFKIFSDPGERVFFPIPGYPLIEHLAQAEGLESVPYSFPTGTQEDLGLSIDRAQDWKVGAFVAIHPHNPLGQYLSWDDLARLDSVCAQQDAALILDEVFWDYAWGKPPLRPTFEPKALTVHLGGLSKTVGLPHMKCSWFALRGPQDTVAEARARLDFLADLYLSVGTPIQNALPTLLQEGTAIRQQILERVKANRKLLEERMKATEGRLTVLPAQAGWASVLRVERPREDEETLALGLLKAGVNVQPGYFFSMEGGVHLVVSLLVPQDTFSRGIDVLTNYIQAHTDV
jgi:alanine-synthesizing transaminase